MTERLFDFDSYIKEFSATVLECIKKENNFLIVLNKTAFFPEGGGQYGDKGFLNNLPVLDTFEQNGKIYHLTNTPLPVGSSVSGKIDWNFRFNNMQNHSGEHIVSGIVNSAFGLNNVGFHMGTDFVTIDYNGVLTKEQISFAEKEANRVVAENLPIICTFPSEKELESLHYRSKKELAGQIRIVEIPSIDVCACCAPHVKTTSEVGIIKLLDFKHYKGGVRINMLCGLRALEDYNKRFENTLDISNKLSCKQYECGEAVDILLNEISKQKQLSVDLEKLLAEEIFNNLEFSNNNIVKFYNFSNDTLRLIADLGRKKCKGLFVALNGTEKLGYKYIISGNCEDFNKKIKELNIKLNGKGGGKPPLAQGIFFSTKDEILKELN